MSAITAKEVLNWHRQEAKRHEDAARNHRMIIQTMEQDVSAGHSSERPVDSEEIRPKIGNLTLSELEAALKLKGGRATHLAQRLGVSPETIEKLLQDPKSHYFIGERAFIYEKPEFVTAVAREAFLKDEQRRAEPR